MWPNVMLPRRAFLRLGTGAVITAAGAQWNLPMAQAMASRPGAATRQLRVESMKQESQTVASDFLALFDPERGRYLPTHLDRSQYLYTAFGLIFATPFPCPELIPVTSGRPDVVVRYAPVPAISLPVYNGTYNQIQFVDGQFLYNKTGVTRALVQHDSQVLLQRVPFVHDDEVRYTFLTIVMSALLLQRGILPMHASAIQTPRGSLLFMGRSGVGKSTLAAELVRRGYLMQADDITPIQMEGLQPMVVPGFPQLKLSLEAAQQVQQDLLGVAQVRPKEQKLSVLKHIAFSQTTTPLRAIIRLEPDKVQRVDIQPLSGMDKFNALLEYTFNQSFLDGLERRADHFRQVTAVGNATEVYAVRRPREGFHLQALADRIESAFITM